MLAYMLLATNLRNRGDHTVKSFFEVPGERSLRKIILLNSTGSQHQSHHLINFSH